MALHFTFRISTFPFNNEINSVKLNAYPKQTALQRRLSHEGSGR